MTYAVPRPRDPQPAPHWYYDPLPRPTLRAVVFDLDGGACPWWGCGEAAVELAHIHSRGMGGRPSADVPANCFAACPSHARTSDLLPPDGGGVEDLRRILAAVPGLEEQTSEYGGPLAWHLADLLTRHVADTRRAAGWDIPEETPA